jgi:hypothetical protein
VRAHRILFCFLSQVSLEQTVHMSTADAQKSSHLNENVKNCFKNVTELSFYLILRSVIKPHRDYGGRIIYQKLYSTTL